MPQPNEINELIEFQQESEKLLEATWEMDAETVAEQIEKIHAEYTSVIQYNNENSLSSVLSIAYLSAIKYYFKPIRELSTGRGFADFVFIPKPLLSCITRRTEMEQRRRNCSESDKRTKISRVITAVYRRYFAGGDQLR
mgnify:CR=1 FL=1